MSKFPPDTARKALNAAKRKGENAYYLYYFEYLHDDDYTHQALIMADTNKEAFKKFYAQCQPKGLSMAMKGIVTTEDWYGSWDLVEDIYPKIIMMMPERDD